MSLIDKLKKNTNIKHSSLLSESIFFTEKDMIPTDIPALNIALSGSLDGGFVPGLTMWAGPSKHFKTGFTLMMVKAYLDMYKDDAVLFYDSEFGSPQSYFEAMGINPERVFHSPITDVEQLKFDIMNQLQNVERGDKLIIVIDSVGNLASKKEVDDALDQKAVADMSRAKQIKSLFRMITPHLTLKNIPMVVVNHTYKEIGMFPKDIVGGGTGSYYSADYIFILGRQQEKDGTELTGYNFMINVEKSRYVKEKSKIPVSISFEGGISRWSGLMDLALEAGLVIKPKNGWYAKVDSEGVIDGKNMRLSETENSAFWKPILQSEKFKSFIEQKYRISNGAILTDEDIESTFGDAE